MLKFPELWNLQRDKNLLDVGHQVAKYITASMVIIMFYSKLIKNIDNNYKVLFIIKEIK